MRIQPASWLNAAPCSEEGDAMITMRLNNNPGYPTTKPDYLGTVYRYRDGAFAVGVNSDYVSTSEVRRYLGGAEPPNYPMPALKLFV